MSLKMTFIYLNGKESSVASRLQRCGIERVLMIYRKEIRDRNKQKLVRGGEKKVKRVRLSPGTQHTNLWIRITLESLEKASIASCKLSGRK